MITSFRHFVLQLHILFNDASLTTVQRQQQAIELLRDLINQDEWLPSSYAQPHPEHYRQKLLYADLQERFSVLSFIWGPGQYTPIHNHGVWGAVGVLRGAEIEERYQQTENNGLNVVETTRLNEKDVSLICPQQGDIHRVKNAYDDRTSVSIHLYAGNIGHISRYTYDQDSGHKKTFISRYENSEVPNLWFEDN